MIKLTKNSVIIATTLWTRYCIKKSVCERSHWNNTPPLLFAPVCVLMDTNERNNWMPPTRCGPRTESYEISCCLIFLPTKKFISTETKIIFNMEIRPIKVCYSLLGLHWAAQIFIVSYIQYFVNCWRNYIWWNASFEKIENLHPSH